MDIEFSIRGPVPDRDSLQDFGLTEMRRIEHLLPDASTAVGVVERVGERYCAFVEARMASGTLSGYSSTLLPEDAIRVALNKVEGRLSKWHEARKGA